MSNFKELSKINVNSHTEKKNGLTYLSWAWAWSEFKQAYPDATYKVIKNEDNLPYFESGAGVIVYTEVTAGGLTHEMWLPVMDGANNAMKFEAYEYTVWNKYKNKEEVKKVAAFDMFDVNKTLMRCLVKNLAMFGLAIYIYAGEDLPELDEGSIDVQAILTELGKSKNKKELTIKYKEAMRACRGIKSMEAQVIERAKEIAALFEEVEASNVND